MKKYSKGFTLIELLVVIAIIGILSSVVLASLGTARNKGKAASVQSSMSSMRAQAEMGNNNGNYLDGLCTTVGTTAGGLATLATAATSTGGTAFSCYQNTSAGTAPTAWGAQITLPGATTGTFYCVDSTGFSGSIPSTKITGTGAVTCQ